MPETDMGNADYSNLSNVMTSYSVGSETTDAGTGQDEFEWQMTDWPKYLGYYKTIPELQTAVDAQANWAVGAGYEAEEPVKILLDGIRGFGKDSFDSILLNMQRVKTIGGDAFAEIITDDDGVLVNLKPLDPGSIKIVSDKKGVIKRYEQTAKHKKYNKRFQPHEIFHLSRKRLADEVHGVSVVKSVEWIILARNEAMNDWKRVLHRNVEPLWIFHLDTDDTAQIASFKSKMDQARANGENMYVPKGAVVPELVTTAQNAALNPLAWINQLNDYFFQAVNVPQIIIGNAKEFTDASSKIVYLSYEQSVKGEQLYLEQQLLSQLNIEVRLTFPASLQQDLISGEQKAPSLEASKPNDGIVEMEGRQ